MESKETLMAFIESLPERVDRVGPGTLTALATIAGTSIAEKDIKPLLVAIEKQGLAAGIDHEEISDAAELAQLVPEFASFEDILDGAHYTLKAIAGEGDVVDLDRYFLGQEGDALACVIGLLNFMDIEVNAKTFHKISALIHEIRDEVGCGMPHLLLLLEGSKSSGQRKLVPDGEPLHHVIGEMIEGLPQEGGGKMRFLTLIHPLRYGHIPDRQVILADIIRRRAIDI